MELKNSKLTISIWKTWIHQSFLSNPNVRCFNSTENLINLSWADEKFRFYNRKCAQPPSPHLHPTTNWTLLPPVITKQVWSFENCRNIMAENTTKLYYWNESCKNVWRKITKRTGIDSSRKMRPQVKRHRNVSPSACTTWIKFWKRYGMRLKKDLTFRF